MMRKIYIAILLVFLMVINKTAYSGIPTVDLVNFTTNMMAYLEEIESAMRQVKQLENQIKQIENADDMLASLKGARNLAGLLNSDAFKSMRRDLPSDPLDVIEQLSNGNLSSALTGSYKDILEDVIELYDVINSDEDDVIDIEDIKERKEQLDKRNIAVQSNALVTSYAAVKVSSVNLATAEKLIDQIDQTEDLKSSLDLNSRIMGEILIQMNQLIKMQGVAGITLQEGYVTELQKKKLMKSRHNFVVKEGF
jgi:type IV secretion system protein VirB5